MAHEVQGVVATSVGAPVSLERVIVPDPGPGEALVRVRACGVGHTDLHYREAAISDDFPFLLGHEAAGQAVKVPEARPEAARLVGCGIMAGIGAALHTGAVQRGDTVAVFGCGGVGNAAIAASGLAGARQVIAVDIDDRKLAAARELGATDTVNSREGDPVEAVRGLTGPRGTATACPAVTSRC